MRLITRSNDRVYCPMCKGEKSVRVYEFSPLWFLLWLGVAVGAIGMFALLLGPFVWIVPVAYLIYWGAMRSARGHCPVCNTKIWPQKRSAKVPEPVAAE